MNTLGLDMDRFTVEAEAIVTMADRYRSDPEFREEMDADPAAILAAKGVELPSGKETRIFCNTADTFHVVMPEDPNLSLDDEALSMVAGSKSASTVGSVGSLSTVVSTASSVSTAGCAGSAAPPE